MRRRDQLKEWWVRIGVEGRMQVVLTLIVAGYWGLVVASMYLAPFK